MRRRPKQEKARVYQEQQREQRVEQTCDCTVPVGKRQQKRKEQWTENAGATKMGLLGVTHFAAGLVRTWDRLVPLACRKASFELRPGFLEKSPGASSLERAVQD
jgi:hypothetical protein